MNTNSHPLNLTDSQTYGQTDIWTDIRIYRVASLLKSWYLLHNEHLQPCPLFSPRQLSQWTSVSPQWWDRWSPPRGWGCAEGQERRSAAGSFRARGSPDVRFLARLGISPERWRFYSIQLKLKDYLLNSFGEHFSTGNSTVNKFLKSNRQSYDR